VDVAPSGWLWEVFFSIRGDTITGSLHKRETVTVSQAWCTTTTMRLNCVSGVLHLAIDMRAA
jgi:hypothetical protein